MSEPSTPRREGSSRPRGALAWMATNAVAANLLMAVAFVAGAFALSDLKQEVFPEFDLDVVQVRVAYPGASPREVEQGVVLAIEEALRGLDGVERVRSNALEGRALVQAELLLGAEPQNVLADAKNAIDRIQSFPEQAERPTVEVLSQRRQVITLVIAGDEPRPVLEDLAERARDRLLQSGDVTQVDIRDLPSREIQIEVPRAQLRALELDLATIAARVGRWAVEVPAGTLETAAGEVAVRTDERRDEAYRFANVPLAGDAATGVVRLGDVATLRDGYALTDQAALYEGEPAVRLIAYRVGEETPTQVATAVKREARALRGQLPDGVHVLTWNDDSRILRERIDLLVDNALLGFALVLLVLGLFLKARLAGWVALGIPISFMGAFAFFPLLDLSINMLTLFALLMTLGLVVDDAIIVGESIFKRMEEGERGTQAAMAGAREVARPVVLSISTTLVAFSPMFFVPGVSGKIFSLIPTVVYAVLVVSLLECFLVLPAHLAHSNAASGRRSTGPWLTRVRRSVPLRWAGRASEACSRAMEQFAHGSFRSVLQWSLRQRYLVVALATSALALTVAVVAAGILPFSFFPEVEANRVRATARLPHGVPFSETRAVGEALRKGAERALEELNAEEASRGLLTQLGSAGPTRDAATVSESGSHLVTVQLELVSAEQREVRAAQIAQTWERALGELPSVRSLRFEHDAGPSAGAAVDVLLRHTDSQVLSRASTRVTDFLRGDPRLFNVVNGRTQGMPQVDVSLRPEARQWGLDSNAVAMQLRAALYGAEALRQQRGRDEVRVMVRLPSDQRESLHDLEQLRIRTPDGTLVPLRRVARFGWGKAPTRIQREDGSRVVHVTAGLRAGVDSARPSLERLRTQLFEELRAKHPGLELRLSGEQREQRESFEALGSGYAVALFVLYVLLAVPFRSYTRPAVVMAVIPFGLLGAVLGHLLMGYNLSIVSLFGLIALSGVVVNDSLVLLDRVRDTPGEPLEDRQQRLEDAAVRRLRPIALTSMTTFLGLAPMIFETSMQARFLVPMAISLGFGVLGASVIVLIVLPCLDLSLYEVRRAFSRHEGPLSRREPLHAGTHS